jgi:CubicO group peptidase (beta-lactamase class C family)
VDVPVRLADTATMPPSHGFAHDRYALARLAFEDNFAGGAEVGASCCATVDGETVVDLWDGYADAALTRPWQRDTIVNVYSCTKAMTALTALLVADRGELDFDAPVARYWPEFAAGGKEQVKVSHLMSHSAGLSGWVDPISREDLYDWDKATGLLAAQAPFWEPGTASGYHPMTQGFLVGEVIRRITGRSLGTVFREEIAEPLGADFHIGLAASEDARVAELIAPAEPPFTGDRTDLQANAADNPPMDVPVTATRAWRGAEIPSAGGTGSARSMAEILAILANGGVANGRRFMSEAGCRRALEPQIEGRDLILGVRVRFGLGFALHGGLTPNRNTLYWGGYGGSLVIVDMDSHTSFGYAMNKMGPGTTGDMRSIGIAIALWDGLAA